MGLLEDSSTVPRDLFPFRSLEMHAGEGKKERGGTAKEDRKQITAVRLLPPHAKSRSVIFSAAKPLPAKLFLVFSDRR